jgi:hypothetical protein
VLQDVRIVIPIVAVLLAGCGGSRVVDRDPSATPPYEGRFNASAAIGALECDGATPYQRGKGVYHDGLASVQESAEAALDDYMREAGLSFVTPHDGYAVERERGGGVLFSYDVDGRTKVSIFAADRVRDWSGDEGWGIRAWAQCDPSELPAEVTDDLNIGVWEDESGRRVPVSRIQSLQGAEHCDWPTSRSCSSGRRRRPTGTCATPAGSSRSSSARPSRATRPSRRARPTRACAETAGSSGSNRTGKRRTS